jgi:hypothetical protein
VFTAFQLFRLPEFQSKLRQIPTPNQRTALLGALLAWGLKGFDHTDVNNLLQEQVLTETTGAPSIHFRGLSLKYMEKAIAELGDEPLSLPLLQAMILNTLCLLVQGVRGRAWRLLGTCIRSAYELNLHLIDAGKSRGQDQRVNPEQWCVEEEWRRAWWAIWEMDVFASVIRRCPAGIDWSQNDTFLPVEDERLYRGEPQSSCLLELNVVERWKSLVASKTQSPKAWFIVINSLMKDAQNISSPMNIDKPLIPDPPPLQSSGKKDRTGAQREQCRKKTDAVKRLSTVLNSLYCTVMALPKELRYHGQYLDFGGSNIKRPGAIPQRLAHSYVYGIYLMTQFTKLMVLKYHVFRTGMDWTFRKNVDTAESPEADPNNFTASSDISDLAMTVSQHLAQYFEAADNVVSIIRCCSDDHFKHVNPFHASIAWLAGAVQLLHRSRLLDDSSDSDFIKSNFDLLCLTYQKTVDFWHMSKVPLRNWETLENGLENIRHNPSSGERYHYETPCIFTGGNMGNQPSSKRISPSGTTQSSTSEYSSVDEIFKCLLTDSGVSDKPASNTHLTCQNTISGMQGQQGFSSISSLNNVYTPTNILDQAQNQQPYSMTSSEPVLGPEHLHPFNSTEAEIGFSTSFLDNNSFAVDRNISMDFSNYLDEMFSGSYLP